MRGVVYGAAGCPESGIVAVRPYAVIDRVWDEAWGWDRLTVADTVTGEILHDVAESMLAPSPRSAARRLASRAGRATATARAA